MGEVSKPAAKKSEAKRNSSVSQSQKANPSHSANPSVDRILFLQRTAGNQAVGRLIKSGNLQAKPRVNTRKDDLEQEAPKKTTSEKISKKAELHNGEKLEVEVESSEEVKEPEKATSLEKAAVKKAPASPKDDPGFQAVVKLAKRTSSREKAHAPAMVKSDEAQAASVSPPSEVAGKAAAGQVQEMDQAEPKSFDRAAFKASLIKKIESITPKNLEEADELKESGKVKSIKGDLTAQVAQSKEQSQGEIKEKVEQAPDKSVIKPKPVTPLPTAKAGPSPKGINTAQAAPKPRPGSDVSLQEGNRKIEQKMDSANITDEMLEKSNEPGFLAAVEAKRVSQANAVEAPKVYRKEEQSTLSKSQSEMTAAAQTQIGAMHTVRQKQLTQVGVQQVNSKGKDEKKRDEIATHIQEIYDGTKEKVESGLRKLDQDVDNIFEIGSVEAQKAFEDYVDNRMKIYKNERYSGAGGSILWAKDKLLGLPDEVNVFYEEGRNLYLKMMDEVLDKIAETVETGLTAAKKEISKGKKDIQNYVDSLPESLKSVGQEAAKEIQSKFDTLEQSVNEKQNQLIDSLAQKYVEKVQQLDNRIQEMKAENRGIVDAAIGALTGVIETIKSLKDMLSNVLSRVKEAVGLIISDPIGFLGNLVAGVKLGFQNFIGKIDKYLLEGLMGWLFGALAEAGIQVPESFDLKGILSIVFQILGLTYQNIRSRAVKIVGEKVVSTMERTAGIFQTLITKGPAVIWDEIKEKLGDFKSMILEPIKNFVVTKVITAGVTWILGLLNPVSAFIKAAKAIYDIIMFFVERASQVMTLINAILDSVVSIAKGNITVAATKVEQALAKAIPVVIGFLAGLLGLGGISEKIKSIIKKVQSPIEKAIDWVIGKAVKLVKSAGKLLGFGKKEETPETKDPEHDLKVQAGLLAIDEEEKHYVKDGMIEKEDAEKIVAKVKRENLIFKSITVIEGENTWNYDYVASPGKKKTGLTKKGQLKRYLPKGYDVREKLYVRGSGWKTVRREVYNDGIKNIKKRVESILEDKKGGNEDRARNRLKILIREEKLPSDTNLNHLTIEDVDSIEYHVDHIIPLAEHWITSGFNRGDKSRWNASINKNNLRLITKEANLEKGGGGYQYAQKPYVGPNFKSVYAENNKSGAKKIDGKLFLNK